MDYLRVVSLCLITPFPVSAADRGVPEGSEGRTGDQDVIEGCSGRIKPNILQFSKTGLVRVTLCDVEPRGGN